MTATRSRAVCYTPTFSGGKAGNRYGGTAARAAPDAARDAHRGLRDPAARARRAAQIPGNPLNDLLALGQGIGPDAGQGADRRSRRRRRSTPRRARSAAPGVQARAGHPGPRARRLARPTACGATSTLIGHQGTSGGFKVLRYVDTAGPRVRVLRHRAAVPAQRAQPQQPAASASPCSTWPTRRTRSRPTADRAPDALAARVAEPQPEARPARGGQRQPGDLPGPRLDLRRHAGLPPPGAAVRPRRWRASATRAASRPTARRSTRPAPRRESITAIDVTNPKDPHVALAGQRSSPTA